MSAVDGGRLGVAAQAIGIGGAALEHALKYAKERKQFETHISEFQAVQFKLADMVTQVSAARGLFLEAARRKDLGEDVTQWAAMAKLFASEMAMRGSSDAGQIFRGYGHLRDYPGQRPVRDAQGTAVY